MVSKNRLKITQMSVTYSIITGFTLLEVLVVLVILTLLMTFLFQTLNHVATARVHILRQLNTFQQGAIQEFWFRHSTAGLIADYPDIEDNQAFKGTDRRFSGLTTAALHADAGVPTAFAWAIVEEKGQNVLQYQADSDTWSVLHWPGEGYGVGFQYLDREGKWHDAWPPQQFGIEPPQLPEAILLTAQRGRHPVTWLIKMNALRDPKPDLRLMEF
jgi:prepilin-type N-terminal cleavage/methylation domain-containing protein